MRIAIDCKALFGDCLSRGATPHITHCLISLISENPQVDFWLFCDRMPDPTLWPETHQHCIQVRKSRRGRLGRGLWQDWQLPQWAKESGVDALLLTGSAGSARLKIPTCQWIADPRDRFAEIQDPGYRRFVQARIRATLRGAGALVTGSCAAQVRLFAQFPEAIGKTTIVHPAPDEHLAPVSFGEREITKRIYAQGKEYFLLSAINTRSDELIGLLKSFSAFKKRLQSNLQLVIIGTHTSDHKTWVDMLPSYKYRGDVHLVTDPDPESQVKVLASAYGVIGLGANDWMVLNAFRAGVPVVDCTPGGSEVWGAESVLWFPEGDQDKLASQLMLLYKDEALRSNLIHAGKIQALQFSWQSSAAI